MEYGIVVQNKYTAVSELSDESLIEAQMKIEGAPKSFYGEILIEIGRRVCQGKWKGTNPKGVPT